MDQWVSGLVFYHQGISSHNTDFDPYLSRCLGEKKDVLILYDVCMIFCLLGYQPTFKYG